jgi:hypothetical protein
MSQRTRQQVRNGRGQSGSRGANAEAMTSHVGVRSTAESRSSFFWGMLGILLLIVFAGFSRTLYLRPFFDVRPVPPI